MYAHTFCVCVLLGAAVHAVSTLGTAIAIRQAGKAEEQKLSLPNRVTWKHQMETSVNTQYFWGHASKERG